MNQIVLLGLVAIVFLMMNTKKSKVSSKSKKSECNMMILAFVGFLVFVMMNKKNVVEGLSKKSTKNFHKICVVNDEEICIHNHVELYLTDHEQKIVTSNGSKDPDREADRPSVNKPSVDDISDREGGEVNTEGNDVNKEGFRNRRKRH